jgi:hypothetical protein
MAVAAAVVVTAGEGGAILGKVISDVRQRKLDNRIRAGASPRLIFAEARAEGSSDSVSRVREQESRSGNLGHEVFRGWP